jgi:hypothetical protein
MCGDVFDKIDDKLTAVIYERFGVVPTEASTRAVDLADRLLLCTESRDLRSPLHPDWKYCEAKGYPVLEERIVPLWAEQARAVFLKRFENLYTEMEIAK